MGDLNNFFNVKEIEIKKTLTKKLENELTKLDFTKKIIEDNLNYFKNLLLDEQYKQAQSVLNFITGPLLKQTYIESPIPSPIELKEDVIPCRLDYVSVNEGYFSLTEKGKEIVNSYKNKFS